MASDAEVEEEHTREEAPRTPEPRAALHPAVTPEKLPAKIAAPEAPATAPALAKSAVFDRVEDLRKEQMALRAQRRKLAAELKAAKRQKNRLKSRASRLTDDDLLEVIQLRRAESQKKSGSSDATPELTDSEGSSTAKKKARAAAPLASIEGRSDG